MERNPHRLFNKLINNSCSSEELDTILKSLTNDEQGKPSYNLIADFLASKENEEIISEEVKMRLNKRFELILLANNGKNASRATVKIKRLGFIKYAAAAVLLFIGIGVALYSFFNQQSENTVALVKGTIHPGRNKAVLTLADGRKIILDEAANGKLLEQEGLLVSKSSDGKVIYQPSATSVPIENTYHTIETPRGGQYQVILSDGSSVWLNATSSLRFPSNFSATERKVELKGEGYFEVAKIKGRRFIVNTTTTTGIKQAVEVLGTHFNINAYNDEKEITTTLLEGSVRVTNKYSNLSKLLSPGEQSGIFADREAIVVSKADTERAVAWKNGYFMFDRENIQSIMRKISRWYDVEIVYKDDVPEDWFAGSISKYKDVEEVLHKLELTGQIKFKISGRTIIVSHQ